MQHGSRQADVMARPLRIEYPERQATQRRSVAYELLSVGWRVRLPGICLLCRRGFHASA
jgi:hypothetical protein